MKKPAALQRIGAALSPSMHRGMATTPEQARKRMRRILSVSVWLTALMIHPAKGAETLAQITERMKLHGAVQLRYEETRHLELMEEPWHGFGFLLAAEPDRLVKLQLQPKREIMAAYDGRLLYYDAARGARYQAAIGNDATSLQVAAFQAIVTGDFARLEPYYDLSHSNDGTGWRLEFNPRPESASLDLARITVEGKNGADAERIVLEQEDGDRSEMRLEKTGEGAELSATVSRLLLEAAGE